MVDHQAAAGCQIESAADGGVAGEPGRWPENFIPHSLGWVPNNPRLLVLLVVVGYPPGQAWDICRDASTVAVSQRIAHVPFPPVDPVTGGEWPLLKLWAATSGHQM